MTHTPGPWRYFDPTGDNTRTSETYFEVAAGSGYTPEGFNLTGFVNEADARLCAAAPDLLAALRLVEAFLSDNRIGTSKYMEGPEFYMDCDEHKRRVRAAIAKATAP